MKDMGCLPLKVDCHSHYRRHSRSKPQLIADARTQVEGISVNYNMGLITITNVTTKLLMLDINAQLTELAMKTLEKTNKVSTQCT
jgi:hypothetical protein